MTVCASDPPRPQEKSHTGPAAEEIPKFWRVRRGEGDLSYEGSDAASAGGSPPERKMGMVVHRHAVDNVGHHGFDPVPMAAHYMLRDVDFFYADQHQTLKLREKGASYDYKRT